MSERGEHRYEDEDGETQVCGDGEPGNICPECFAEDAAYWGAYFGIRNDMTPEQRKAQLEKFAPPGRSVYQDADGAWKEGEEWRGEHE